MISFIPSRDGEQRELARLVAFMLQVAMPIIKQLGTKSILLKNYGLVIMLASADQLALSCSCFAYVNGDFHEGYCTHAKGIIVDP